MNDQYRWDNPISRRTPPVGRFGGREPILSMPGVVTGLVLINALIFILQSVLPWEWILPILNELAFSPARFTAGMNAGADPFGLVVPVFGHMFVHGDISHILFNSIWLIVFGTGVARRMGTDWGDTAGRFFRTSFFLTFYLICGLAGLLAYYLVQPLSPVPVVGASGAISGLMGAAMRFVVLDKNRQRDPALLAGLFSRPIILVTIAFTLMNLGTSLSFGMAGGPRIAWEAHMGGYLAGLILFPLFDIAGKMAKRQSLG